MSLVDVDSWQTEYNACKRLNETIHSRISRRDAIRPVDSEYKRLTSAIHIELKQFCTELQQLKFKLDAAAKSGSITFENIESRQIQVDTLQSQLLQLQKSFDETTLMQPISSANTQPALIETNSVDILKRKQIQILEDQNRGLESLSQTISRQRELATQLGQEVEDQNDILDNLANTMENVDARVNLETGNIGVLNRRDNTCGYWVVIVLLFIVNVLVAILL